ncbi:MAG: polynucleotide adenylyltransferase PcnB [Spirochaetes bacterium]|nr:polynucleotide adenylyltransferase PcnB [Spirochaetota bacterium]
MRIRYSAGKNGQAVKRALVYTHDEHKINFSDVDAEAVGIIKRLKDSGFDTYIVGGAVRDLILGKKPKDFDIASEANPARIKKIFRNSRIIGRRFRLVHIYFEKRIFEVSTFRSLKHGSTGNNFGSIEEDVLRRDFTMNALFYDPLEQVVIDYVGGMKDIMEKKLMPIIPIPEIFKDDPVRMIRAVKYAAATGFAIPLRLKWKIKKESSLLAGVSASRLTEEIFKIINSPHAAAIVEDLDRFGLYCYLQPGAAKLMKENPDFRRRYMASLSSIKGEVLGSLVNDYLEDVVDFDLGAAESYKTVLAAARSFVMPMSPPRFQLEQAVRNFFLARGFIVKKS